MLVAGLLIDPRPASPSGSISFNPVTGTTAADGTASTSVTLGSDPGSIEVTATAPTLLPAPDGLISIFGRGLVPEGTSQQVGSGQLVNGHLPTGLDGVCVRVNSSYANILYVSPNQVNIQAPTKLPAGTANVQVVFHCATSFEIPSNSQTVPVQVAAPEFFYLSHRTNGGDPVAAFHATSGTPVTVQAPARAGEILSLFGTGFGLTNPPVQAGVIPDRATPLANPATVKDRRSNSVSLGRAVRRSGHFCRRVSTEYSRT